MSTPRHLVPAFVLAGLTALTLVLSFALSDPADASVAGGDAAATPVVSHDALQEMLGGESAPPGRALLHRGTDGYFDGYRVSDLSKGLLGLGLENGDLVRGVNGMPLTSLDEAFAAYDALQDASLARIDLTRRGVPHALEVVLR